jgi:hypothetical protein
MISHVSIIKTNHMKNISLVIFLEINICSNNEMNVIGVNNEMSVIGVNNANL